jgi:hypothetical protein
VSDLLPFNLEEAKVDPSRVRHVDGKTPKEIRFAGDWLIADWEHGLVAYAQEYAASALRLAPPPPLPSGLFFTDSVGQICYTHDPERAEFIKLSPEVRKVLRDVGILAPKKPRIVDTGLGVPYVELTLEVQRALRVGGIKIHDAGRIGVTSTDDDEMRAALY